MNGAERITLERKRQIEEEGWGSTHDAEHEDGELAWAAVCYAAPRAVYRCEVQDGEVEDDSNPGPWVRFYDPWPWQRRWDKRGKAPLPKINARIRDLVKAGALIAAEIDRLSVES